jgi:hypothetical protein
MSLKGLKFTTWRVPVNNQEAIKKAEEFFKDWTMETEIETLHDIDLDKELADILSQENDEEN